MSMKEFYHTRKSRKCMSVADDVYGLLEARQMGPTDGIFTLTIALARCIQTECEGLSQREAMVTAIMQIMTRAVVTLDETLLGVVA
jgi:hypothetical protein